MKFLKGVKEEMKLTTWPTRKENAVDSKTVITTTILYGAFFAVVDTAFMLLMKQI